LYVDVEHKELGKFRRIRGSDFFVLQRKAQEQRRLWEDQWQRKCEIEEGRNQRKRAAYDKASRKALAESQTADAQSELDDLRNILKETMSLKEASWASLYDRTKFVDRAPKKRTLAEPPVEPRLEDPTVPGDILLSRQDHSTLQA
jgi:restriction system protein